MKKMPINTKAATKLVNMYKMMDKKKGKKNAA